jgi:starch synthase
MIDGPVFGFIARLTNQKGSELIYQIVPKLIKDKCQFVFLGQGEDFYENQLKELAFKFKGNVYTKIGFDPSLAQKIYAGADIFLMPSLFEPCGLGQMIAMRYGTPPIVRNVGGLKDSVKNVRIFKNKISGNGFVFKKYSPFALLKTIKIALRLFKNKKIWRKIQKNGMKEDFSWENSAKKYLKLYHQLLKK